MRRFLALLPVLLLAACEPPADTTPRPISFKEHSPIRLNVSEVVVDEEYRSTGQAPFIERQFPTPPAEAVRSWAEDRLVATGSANTLRVIMKDASVRSTPLPRTQGVQGVFVKDQAEKLDARVEVELRIYTDRAVSSASVNAVSTRSETVLEGTPPNTRREIYDRMARRLMTALNAELEKNIQQYFNAYIVYE